MKHFGIFIADMESERFSMASNDQIATWLYLHTFCSKQTNGGTICDAANLPERFWSRHGINHGTLTTDSPLWSWSGEALTVEPYDIDGEALYLKKVKGGKDGATRRWKGTENGSPNKSPHRPNLTLPDQTLPKKKRASVFQKPTLEMVKEYGMTLTPPFTAGCDFIDYYEGNGWKIGSSPMQDWKATVNRWNRKSKSSPTTAKPPQFLNLGKRMGSRATTQKQPTP